jgi:hypothetical protein
METRKGLKIFILGAGCSAGYGYPLAKRFLETLKNYGVKLEKRAKSDRLKRIVSETVDLMEQRGTPTVDRLVRSLDEEAKRTGPLSKIYVHPDNQRLRDKQVWADDQVLHAKIVTMAMFLEQEEAVRVPALCGYRDFLSNAFGGSRNLNSLATTNIRLLSFNYDRLFEMAFADYFDLEHASIVNWYRKGLLNSGWDGAGGPSEEVAEDRFCFLKMHGSASAWIRGFYGQPRYHLCSVIRGANEIINDEFFWPPGRNVSPWPSENPQPFIVFPHEKEGVRRYDHRPVYKAYLDATWRKAEELVENAGEIWVIGYSFDPNDRQSLMGLLGRSASKCEIIVQNDPDAKSICDELSLRYRDLATRFKPLAKRF